MKVGDEVVCINTDNIDNRIANKPALHAHYHVRDIIKYVLNKPGAVGILLDEIENELVKNDANGMKHEPSFDINRFATLDEIPAQEEANADWIGWPQWMVDPVITQL